MSIDDSLGRIGAAQARLIALRPAVRAGEPWPLAERFDDAPEASWGPPEILAHVDEMIGFWHGELVRIVAARRSEPVPFGRTAADTSRMHAIEHDRHRSTSELDAEVDAKIDAFAAAIATWTAEDLARVGLHPRLGDVTVEAGIDRFITNHLVDHADQLEAIVAGEA